MVEFRGIQASEVNFSRARFCWYLAGSSTFTSCDFSHVRIDEGNLGNDCATIYRRCRFDGADLRNANPLFARFEQCSFDGADFRGFRSFYAEFVECHFAGRIVSAKFFGLPEGLTGPPRDLTRKTNEFRGNDFREAELIDTGFVHGIEIEAQQWPQGDAYVMLDRIHERIEKARAAVLSWQDHKARKEALVMLQIYSQDTEHQDGLFARRDDVPIARSNRDQVWDLLLS
jgi:pentapeptide repeat protein